MWEIWCTNLFCGYTTYAVASKIREENQELIDENLENLNNFLSTNSLCIIETKTCLIETMNHLKRCKVAGRPPSIIVKDENGDIVDRQAYKDCRLLGANFAQYLTWKAHLLTGETSNPSHEEACMDTQTLE